MNMRTPKVKEYYSMHETFSKTHNKENTTFIFSTWIKFNIKLTRADIISSTVLREKHLSMTFNLQPCDHEKNEDFKFIEKLKKKKKN